MSFFVNNIAGSLAGTQQQGAAASKKIRKQDEEDRRRKRGVRDEFERSVSQAREADTVRSAKDSTQEESREDQAEHDVGYHRPHDPDSPGIDLSA